MGPTGPTGPQGPQGPPGPPGSAVLVSCTLSANGQSIVCQMSTVAVHEGAGHRLGAPRRHADHRDPYGHARHGAR